MEDHLGGTYSIQLAEMPPALLTSIAASVCTPVSLGPRAVPGRQQTLKNYLLSESGEGGKMDSESNTQVGKAR